MTTTIKIVLLCLLAVSVVVILTATCRKMGKSFPWRGVLVAIVLLLLGSCGYSKLTAKKSPTPVTTPTGQGITTPPPAQAATPVPAQPVWTHKTITIPKGGIAVRLYNGWRIWPIKGGAIMIITPNQEVIHGALEVTKRVGNQPDGIYLITSDPVGYEREVEIYNRW